MSDERRRAADAIFRRALDVAADAREAFVHDVCGDDAALRDEVLALLRSDPGTEADLPVAGARLGPRHKLITDPDRIGPYRVLQRLGTGGFGVVYEVEQTEPVRRRLALKVLKAGMDSEEVLARFEAERQALALMDHPNIARVVDAGATDQGRPYFAMELVKGDAITLYCDREKLDLDARIDLFLEACRAVQHAHQKGILHRDLKPSNILVTRVDGRPVAKIIDFGIAKALSSPLTSRTLHTVMGQVMGTPAYMSPEQSDRSGLAADTTTDVYSLGVVLYELLCGRLPVAKEEFDVVAAENYGDVVRSARRVAPSARFEPADEDAIQRAWWRGSDPWHLRSRLRGDLDWIVMRAIASDRPRRYQSVQELIEEIGRHRDDEPVHAGPPTVGYRARKFARRHRTALFGVCTVLLGLLAAGAGLTWALLRSNAERARTELAQQESEAVLGFLVSMLASARPSERGTDLTVRELLDETAGRIGQDFAGRPLVEARLRSVVGTSYRELGAFDPALTHLQQSYDMFARASGPESDEALDCARELGVLQRMRGEYAAAESVLSDVLELRRAQTPVDQASVARALDDLSSVYLMEERNADAIPLLESALELADAGAVRPGFDSATVLSNLGLAYQAVGRYEEAERAQLRMIALESERYGPDHVFTWLAGQPLGALYRETGQLEKAAPYYEHAYQASIEVFGEDNPTTVRTRHNLALLLTDLGRYDEALGHSLEVVRIRERTLGADNPATIASLLNLGLLYAKRREWEPALRTARTTVDRARAVVGADHLYTLTAEDLQANVLRELGDASRAEPLLRDVIARAEGVFPADHWRLARLRAHHAACLIDLGRAAEAEPVLLAAHAKLASQFGETDDRTVEIASTLARAYEQLGRPDEAARWRDRPDGH